MSANNWTIAITNSEELFAFNVIITKQIIGNIIVERIRTLIFLL